jgi:hypothetical protein
MQLATINENILSRFAQDNDLRIMTIIITACIDQDKKLIFVMYMHLIFHFYVKARDRMGSKMILNHTIPIVLR